ncbi:MAG: TrkH family potassium uptake protein [Alphaproteobacteria bacterium]
MNRSSKTDFRPVFMVCGLTVALFAAIMLIPALVDFLYDGKSWVVFLESAGVCFFLGLAMFFSTRTEIKTISVKQAFLFTVLVWVMLTVTASLPFYIFLFPNSYVNAFFESISGLSTTGSTVITGLDDMSKGILLWRSILHCIGGVGIVVVAFSVFPYFRVGGMQIFQMESSENFGKISAKMGAMAKAIILVYFILQILCTILLRLAGMSWFDAINHAMSALSTGGFSTKDASVGYYNNPLYEFIIMIFVISAGLPLTYYVRLFKRGNVHSAQDTQVLAYLGSLAVCILIVTFAVFYEGKYSFIQSLRHASFNVSSLFNGTGFASQDYSKWGFLSVAMFMFFPFIGGCTGSTAGSIKIFRWQILLRYLKESIVQLFLPHRVVKMKYGRETYTTDLVLSVAMFFAVFIISWGVLSILVALTGVDLVTSLTSVASSLGNVGPGLGDIVGPAGNYLPLPDAAKWWLSLAMMAGRLEIFTLLVLFMPAYWRD